MNGTIARAVCAVLLVFGIVTLSGESAAAARLAGDKVRIGVITKMCIETMGVTNRPDDLEADRDRIAKCWAGLKSFDGLLGAVTMGETGVNAGQIWPLILKRGVFVLAE